MDRDVYQTDEPFYLETGDNAENKTTTSVPLVSREDGLILRISVSAIAVLMLLTLLGNAVVIITIISCAELRKKRINVFILNLALGDLMVCFVSMPAHVLIAAFSHWRLGDVTCKFAGYGFVVAVAFTIFLLTAMSIDRYQVRPYDEYQCYNLYVVQGPRNLYGREER